MPMFRVTMDKDEDRIFLDVEAVSPNEAKEAAVIAVGKKGTIVKKVKRVK